MECRKQKKFSVIHSMNAEDDHHPLFPDYEVEVYKITNTFNWYTGKGPNFWRYLVKKEDGSRGKNPKIEIFANGKCELQEKKF